MLKYILNYLLTYLVAEILSKNPVSFFLTPCIYKALHSSFWLSVCYVLFVPWGTNIAYTKCYPPPSPGFSLSVQTQTTNHYPPWKFAVIILEQIASCSILIVNQESDAQWAWELCEKWGKWDTRASWHLWIFFLTNKH